MEITTITLEPPFMDLKNTVKIGIGADIENNKVTRLLTQVIVIKNIPEMMKGGDNEIN